MRVDIRLLRRSFILQGKLGITSIYSETRLFPWYVARHTSSCPIWLLTPYIPLNQILKLYLFSPGSMDNANAARLKVNAELWGVDHITAGAIAFAATMVRVLTINGSLSS
jgi:hypothetical protein